MRYRFEEFEVDTERYELTRTGALVTLDRTPFDLLAYFLGHPGTLIPREQLLADVWEGVAVTPKTVNTALYELRRALGDDAKSPRFIETVRGRGYRLVAGVRESSIGRVGIAHPPFVGRLGELDDLTDGLDSARRGEGVGFLLSGPPGIGKSRLLSEFGRIARERSIPFWLARCPEVEGTPPYWPWIQLLERERSESDESTWKRAVSLNRGIEALAREATGVVRGYDYDPTLSPFAVADALVNHWLRPREQAPIVIAIEDLHRADSLSWGALAHLAENIGDSNVVMVATARTRGPGVATSKPLIPKLLALPSIRHIELKGLTEEDLRKLSLNYGVASGSAARSLREDSGGNPLYATRLLASGLEGRQSAGGLLGLVRREFGSLSPETVECLEAASVLGRDFDVHDLRSVLGADPSASLAAAQRSGLVERVHGADVLRFGHVLLRDALYDSIAPRRKSALHLKAAAAVGGPAETVVHHLEHAGEYAEWEQIITWRVAASENAARRSAVEEALSQLRAAASAVPASSPQRDSAVADLAIRAGELMVRSGRQVLGRKELISAHSSAIRAGRPEVAVRAALASLPGLLSIEAGAYDPSVAGMLEVCLGLELEPAQEAMLRVQLAVANLWGPKDPGEQSLLLKRATELARGSDSVEIQAQVACAAYVARQSPDNLSERINSAAECRRLASRADVSDVRVLSSVISVALALETADRLSFEREVATLSKSMDVAPSLEAAWYPLLYQGTRSLLDGDFDKVESVVQALSNDLAGREDANVHQSIGSLLAVARFYQGRAVEVVEAVERAALRFPGSWVWQAASALVEACAGQVQGANLRLDSLIDVALNSERDLVWLFSVGLLTDAAIELGRLDHADALLGALTPYRDQCMVAGFGILSWGSVARLVGELEGLRGEIESAVANLRVAEAVETRMQNLPTLARTQAALSRWLREVDPESASLARGSARSLASNLGMARLVEVLKDEA